MKRSYVLILLQEEDYHIMRLYDAMALKCWSLAESGDIKSWKDIQSHIPANENYLGMTKRKTGVLEKRKRSAAAQSCTLSEAPPFKQAKVVSDESEEEDHEAC